MVEHRVSALPHLSECISHPRGPENSISLATEIYYTQGSLEGRIAIVNAAFRKAITWSDTGEADNLVPIALQCWQEVHKQLREKKEMRNRVAHGMSCLVPWTGGRPTIRLTSDPTHPRSSFKSRSAGQLPGLGAADVAQSADAASSLAGIPEGFVHLLDAGKRGGMVPFGMMVGRLEIRLGLAPPPADAPAADAQGPAPPAGR